MYKVGRHICRLFHIDTNRINSRSNFSTMNTLERWHKHGVISIEWSEVARDEALIGNDHLRTEKANDYIFTETLALTNQEQDQLNTIKRILFPSETINSNKWNDIEIVFNALKYGAILITDDGSSRRRIGILDHKNELMDSLGLLVMSDIEAIEYIQKLIQVRDNSVYLLSERYGTPLPSWVGKD